MESFCVVWLGVTSYVQLAGTLMASGLIFSYAAKPDKDQLPAGTLMMW